MASSSSPTLLIHILTDLEERGSNYFCYGMDEEGTVMEVHLVSIGKHTAKGLAQKLHKRKFYIFTHFSLNKREECAYLRLSADKAKIFQTAKEFTLPEEKLQEFFHPAQCTIPHALASPKKRRLSVGGTIAQVYELKQGAHWKRRDVLLADNSTGKKICCKLWGEHAAKISEGNKGSTVTIENVEVDVYNDNHQLRSTTMTTIQIENNTSPPTQGDFTIIGVDVNPENPLILQLITEDGQTFNLATAVLQHNMTTEQLIRKTPFSCTLHANGDNITTFIISEESD